jgi:hypothetical protein
MVIADVGDVALLTKLVDDKLRVETVMKVSAQHVGACLSRHHKDVA